MCKGRGLKRPARHTLASAETSYWNPASQLQGSTDCGATLPPVVMRLKSSRRRRDSFMNHQGRASLQIRNLNRSHSDQPLPDDFFRKLRYQIERAGEVRLALAVFEDAVGCLNGKEDPWKYPPRLFRWEAEQWIESRDRKPLFSFESVCSILHIEARTIRAQIHRWRARQSRPDGQRIPISRRGAPAGASSGSRPRSR